MVDYVYYLHGFASSARSTKAAFFAERLRPYGINLRVPDFNEPDFASLTITRMIEQVASDVRGLPAGRVALIGSSLGAMVAVYAALGAPARIDRLVLLAPALTLEKDGQYFVEAERLVRWRSAGELDVFHFGYGETRPLNYSFYEDSQRYQALEVELAQPILIFQGLRDETVDHRVVERYAAARPNVTLVMLDDEHQLAASLPRMWTETKPFLGLS